LVFLVANVGPDLLLSLLYLLASTLCELAITVRRGKLTIFVHLIFPFRNFVLSLPQHLFPGVQLLLPLENLLLPLTDCRWLQKMLYKLILLMSELQKKITFSSKLERVLYMKIFKLWSNFKMIVLQL
jgi:hypothetical protein